MLPCYQCAYKKTIPGNCHISCSFDWPKFPERCTEMAELPNSVTAHSRQWFNFPLNYDPVWGPKTCPSFAETANPEHVREFSDIEKLLSLLS